MNQQPVISHEAPIHDRQSLPVHLPDPLVGRESDVSSIQPALKAGTAVLLHGPAGTGKTALAAALAAEYAESPGGIVWLDIQQDTLPSLVLRLTRALGADLVTSLDDMDQQIQHVQDMLNQTRPLLVLDGDIPVDTVRTFIRTCANGIPLLFMHSRMAAGSWTPYAIGPLSTEDATVLLSHHAKRENMADHQPLLDVLGGYPLAIQIVGRQLAASGIDAEQFLATMPKLPPGEANRIMGILMTAYRLLPKDLQGLILLLGTTFTSGASNELLAEVSKAPANVISEKMRQLVEHGFAYERTVNDHTIFFTHELVKTFAQTFLRGKKQLEAMQTRHLTSLLSYTQRHINAPTGDQPHPLRIEMPNILAASIFAAQHDPSTLDQLVQLLEPTTPESFIAAHGFQLEYEWLRMLLQDPALAESGILGEPDAPAEAPPEPVAAVPVPPTPAEPSAEITEPSVGQPADTEEEPLAAVGDAADHIRPTTEHVAIIPAAIEEPLPDATVPADMETQPEPATDQSSEPEPQVESVKAATAPAPAVELPANAEGLEKLRQQAVTTGDTEQAIEQYSQALESYKADGNIEDELAAIEALAELNLENDNYEDVLKYLERGTALAQEASNPRREGEMLVILGDLQMELGRFEGAESAYKEAVSAFQPTGAWLDIGLALDKLAIVYDDTGRWQDAIDIWEQTIPIFEREQRTDLLRYVHGEIGDNHTDLMRWNQAKQSYSKALELAETDDDEAGMYDELSRLAWLMETSGQQAEALPYYQRALHLALKLENQAESGETMLALARLLIDETTHLNRVLQLLESALECLPGDTDIQRLLNRANKRKERLAQAGIDLPTVDDSVQDYARSAAEAE